MLFNTCVFVTICLQAVLADGRDYIGCFKDSRNRVLPNRLEDVNNVADCREACGRAGYRYAGVQYGKQCFCGNNVDAPSAENCDMKCRNGHDICGGRWANSVYRSSNTDSAHSNPGPIMQIHNQVNPQPNLHKFLGRDYIGCFKDSRNRVLPNRLEDVNNVADCREACGRAGYRYAGVQYGKQCFCGNKVDAPSAENCNMPCPNGHDICGGRWANSVYRSSNTDFAHSNPGPIMQIHNQVNPQPNLHKFLGRDYIGCFKDSRNRVLPNRLEDVNNVADCREACGRAGYRYAGVQYGKQCFCGNKVDAPYAENCDMPCPNGHDICGGRWANSVYRSSHFRPQNPRPIVQPHYRPIQQPYYQQVVYQRESPRFYSPQYIHSYPQEINNMPFKSSLYMGCYQDNSLRFLPNQMNDIQGVTECVDACRNAGYLYAGVQNGRQCFCGNEYNKSPSSNNCNMKCPNEKETCGGFWANSIYSTFVPQQQSAHPYPQEIFNMPVQSSLYMGCYQDNSLRFLPNQMNDIQGVAECVDACRNAGYLYAGVQYGHQCFCGNEYNKSPSSNNCDMKCPNQKEICGGFWANSIYSTYDFYVGCYRDINLSKQMFNVEGVLGCLEACSHADYKYAGLMSGRRCFCGNEYNTHYTQSSNCNLKCQNEVEICGGLWAKSIYRTFISRPDHNPQFPYQEEQRQLDYNYIGCFRDRKNHYLPTKMGDIESVDQCARACLNAGFECAGIQYGKQCFCGNLHQSAPPAKNCNMKCLNGDGNCGGYWTKSFFRIVKH